MLGRVWLKYTIVKNIIIYTVQKGEDISFFNVYLSISSQRL